jgi:hypothetical protein
MGVSLATFLKVREHIAANCCEIGEPAINAP